MIGSYRYDVSGSGILEEGDQMIRVKMRSLPHVDDIFVSDLGRMPEMLQMVVISRMSLDVHIASIPVIEGRHCMGIPAYEDTELGIPEPIRTSVLFKRFPA